MKKQIAAGRFKAECLALLDRVERTGESIIVTKRGRPVAEIAPVQAPLRRSLRGSVVEHGDVVAPVLGSWDIDE